MQTHTVCAAEKPYKGWLRTAGASLLILIALAEAVMAALMFAGLHSIQDFVFLLCTLGLLAAAVVSAREPAGRASFAVQSAAAAALLALFWAGGSEGNAGPSITLRGATYQLTLTLAALLFIALLLGTLLRRAPQDQTCKCG